MSKNLNLHIGGAYIGEQYRQPADIRDDLSSYTYVDVSLRYKIPSMDLTIQASGKNIFDADIREPSDIVVDETAFNIVNDLPQAGSAFYINVLKSF